MGYFYAQAGKKQMPWTDLFRKILYTVYGEEELPDSVYFDILKDNASLQSYLAPRKILWPPKMLELLLLALYEIPLNLLEYLRPNPKRGRALYALFLTAASILQVLKLPLVIARRITSPWNYVIRPIKHFFTPPRAGEGRAGFYAKVGITLAIVLAMGFIIALFPPALPIIALGVLHLKIALGLGGLSKAAFSAVIIPAAIATASLVHATVKRTKSFFKDTGKFLYNLFRKRSGDEERMHPRGARTSLQKRMDNARASKISGLSLAARETAFASSMAFETSTKQEPKQIKSGPMGLLFGIKEPIPGRDTQSPSSKRFSRR